MERRSFLKNSCLGAAALSAGASIIPKTISAQNGRRRAGQPVIVQVFLRGGQDQLNTFVPYTDNTYYDIRPTIAVPKNEVIKVDKQFGFHPALKPLEKAFRQGRFAPIINSGSPHPTRSHFDAQDFMEYAAPGDRSTHNGWLNRYLSSSAKEEENKDDVVIRALAMQERLPRSLRGSFPVVAVPNNLANIDEVLELFEDMYQSGDPEKVGAVLPKAVTKLNAKGSRKLATALASSAQGAQGDAALTAGIHTIKYLRKLRKVIHGPGSERLNTVKYPTGGFASQLSKLTRVIKSNVGLEVAGVDYNGWDHHIGLGATNGTLNRMLTFFAASLAAFMDDLGDDLNRTIIIVSTEFGRVAAENGNDGSDHGHGGATWLMGGEVNGGKFYGDWTGLEPKELNQKRDLKVTTDFRDIYGSALVDHMKFELPEKFFPKFKMSKKGLGLFNV